GATRLEIGGDGACTGRLDGPNCRGAEKVRRLTDWLESDGLGLGEVTLWAYGDSSGDRELLAAAQHPHLVDGPLGNV
ncbi:MAG: haloacid dehalogenase-like hydrolase, partial [Ilumatobacteraceae bacterium]